MAWERRSHGGSYSMRKRRDGGRVISQYLGAGPAARLAAELDTVERRARASKRREVQRQQQQSKELDAEVGEACRDIETALQAELVAAGFHLHHRGEWRKRRGKEECQEAR